MTALVAGLIIFFAVHSISIVNELWRDRVVARVGEGPWKGLYSLAAMVGLVLMIWGYGTAREEAVVFYYVPPAMKHLAMVLMVPVFPLLLATYFPGRIKAMTRNPMLIATIFWSAAHLLANGRLSDMLLFGSFLLWALLDLFSMSRRNARPVPGAPAGGINDLIVLVGGLVFYGLFIFWLHAWLTGVPLLMT